MAHYIFIQGVRPGTWELLEKVERADLAAEAFRNYKLRLSGRKHEVIKMVEAPNVLVGQASLSSEFESDPTRCQPFASAQMPWRQK